MCYIKLNDIKMLYDSSVHIYILFEEASWNANTRSEVQASSQCNDNSQNGSAHTYPLYAPASSVG